MKNTNRQQRRYSRAVAWTLVLAVGLLLSGPALAKDKLSSKLEKKIKVMEMIIDEMLVDSPNLLVYSGEPSSSIYLEEFGVIFAFEASLAHDQHFMKDWIGDLGNVHIETDDDKVIVYKNKKKKSSDEDEDDDGKSYEESEKEQAAKEAERYAGGKEELVDTLMDYGDTLTELKDDQFVAIAARLTKADYFREHDLSRLIVKVKVSDLRSHSTGNLSRKDLAKRITVAEY